MSCGYLQTDGRPRVVLAGFGSCFGGNRKDLFVPFEHERLDTRVGDPSSQAPEVTLFVLLRRA